MKRIELSLLALALASMAVAQTPQAIKYQSMVRDNAGVELVNQSVGIRISVLQSSESGPEVYAETHTVTTNAFGLANLNIGSGNVVSGDFSTIAWGADTYFFKIELDATGGTNYQFIGTSQSLSVPYALHARTAETVTGAQWATNGDGIHNANVGNVGIGITAPAHKLDIMGNALVRGTEYDSFGDSAVLFLGDGTSSVQNTYGTGLQFYTYPGGGPGITLRNSTNNVGIGTETPTDKLTVRTATNNFGFTHTDGTITVGSFVGGGTGGGSLGTKSNHAFHLFTNNNAAQMSLLTNGNVGIGTTNPTQKLDVNGALQCKDHLVFNSTNGVINWGPSGDLLFRTLTAMGNIAGYTDRMVITGGGNVGIGTPTPGERLAVVGNICYTGTIGACSDRRYKTDFTPLSGSLAKVGLLNGLYYTWRTEEFPEKEFPAERQLGFIAQDIEVLFPEVVLTDAQGYKSVDYGRLTPVLVEAIKELNALVQQQQATISDQHASLNTLRMQVDANTALMQQLQSVLEAQSHK